MARKMPPAVLYTIGGTKLGLQPSLGPETCDPLILLRLVRRIAFLDIIPYLMIWSPI